MQWEKAIIEKEGKVKLPDNWISLHYFEGLNVLFRFENILRMFVYVVLKNALLEKWDVASIEIDKGKQESIKSIAKKRMTQAEEFGHLGYRVTCPIMYLTIGDLNKFIISDSYWKNFKKYFRFKKEDVNRRLSEISHVRNALAHFRPIKETDIEDIKRNADQILIDIEKNVEQLLKLGNSVPTNTEDEWYQRLKKICPENFRFYQSDDAKWVKIIYDYKCPVIEPCEVRGKYVTYRFLNLISPSILEKCKELTRYMTYLSESIKFPKIDKKLKPHVEKNIRLVFAREILDRHYEQIGTEIGSLLSKIAREREVLELNRGEEGTLVKIVEVSAIAEDDKMKSFNIEYKKLFCITSENSLPEFWGNDWDYRSKNFATDTAQYPWMPVKISAFIDIPQPPDPIPAEKYYFRSDDNQDF
jgi:hypothetical protein